MEAKKKWFYVATFALQFLDDASKTIWFCLLISHSWTGLEILQENNFSLCCKCYDWHAFVQKFRIFPRMLPNLIGYVKINCVVARYRIRGQQQKSLFNWKNYQEAITEILYTIAHSLRRHLWMPPCIEFRIIWHFFSLN